MKCKYCGQEMAEWGGFCPVCGKNSAAEEAEHNCLDMENAEPEELLTPEDIQEETEVSPKLKKMKRNMAMAGCFALLAVLATVLFFGIRGESDLFSWLKPRENNIFCKDSYTVTDKKVERKKDVVVATLGDAELTNAQLQIYYWFGVQDFLSSNYYYLSYMGFDYTLPLDEQPCYFDKTMTWQQYFLQTALESWQSSMSFVRLAKENNFQMPEEYRKELDNMEKDLTETAKRNNFASVDELIQQSFGASCTLQDYLEYMENYYLGYLYFAELYEAIDPSVEELNAYFEANKEALEREGVKKDGSYTIDVRHILVKIDNIVAEMEKDSKAGESAGKYTEEHWNACQTAAQKIYDEFLAGDKSEELFGELANKYSHDQGGKVTNGGIYTFVKKGQMVAEFDAWCFAEGRKPGDTGLVKTQYGYHVMYFVGSEETWITGTRNAYIAEESDRIVKDALDDYELEVNYKKIVIGNVTL